MRTPGIVAAAAVLGLLGGCVPSPGPTPSSSVTPALDLTAPGEARSMLRRLIAQAGTSRLIQVEVTRLTARITVVKDGRPEAWAWRDGEIKQVASDVEYVQQASFSLDAFNISDVGGLFRAASSISGSESNQELQIVDSSAGEVMMTVSTNPESRTVFFHAGGALLEILDFDTEGGVRQGLADVVDGRATALAVGIQSNVGVWLDFPGSTRTTIRRLRTSMVPVTINERAEAPVSTFFDPTRVDPRVVWQVLAEAREEGRIDGDTDWSVTVEHRTGTGAPRMYFTIGGRSVVTDLAGEPVAG